MLGMLAIGANSFASMFGGTQRIQAKVSWFGPLT
jgi:hypothetical protein